MVAMSVRGGSGVGVRCGGQVPYVPDVRDKGGNTPAKTITPDPTVCCFLLANLLAKERLGSPLLQRSS